MKRIKVSLELYVVTRTRHIFARRTEDPRQCQLLVVDRLLITKIKIGEVPQMCQLALTRLTII